MSRKKGPIKRLRNSLIYYFLRVLVFIMRSLPRRASIRVMRGLARVVFYGIKSRRERTLKHLRMAFGREKTEKEIQETAKKVFLNLGACAADAIRIPKMIGRDLDALMTVEGREHLDRVVDRGESTIFLTGHFGNWELLAAWFAMNGCKIKAVATPGKDPRIDRMIVENRIKSGLDNIARGTDTREILKGIRDGYSLGILIDQDTKVEGVFVKFFNRWAHTATGPAVLARKYGLQIIPAFIRLKEDFTYHIEIQDPLPLEKTGNKSRDILHNTQLCSDAYEKIIRRHPEQWAWMHRRWKKQPHVEKG